MIEWSGPHVDDPQYVTERSRYTNPKPVFLDLWDSICWLTMCHQLKSECVITACTMHLLLQSDGWLFWQGLASLNACCGRLRHACRPWWDNTVTPQRRRHWRKQQLLLANLTRSGNPSRKWPSLRGRTHKKATNQNSSSPVDTPASPTTLIQRQARSMDQGDRSQHDTETGRGRGER